MAQAISVPSTSAPASPSRIEALARRATAAYARHTALIGPYLDTPAEPPAAVQDAAAAALAEWSGALAGLSALPATTSGDLRAKGTALATCIHVAEGDAPLVCGDAGLAVSLIADLAGLPS